MFTCFLTCYKCSQITGLLLISESDNNLLTSDITIAIPSLYSDNTPTSVLELE